ncbi:MAG TPA: cyanophycinase [Rhodanobacteraceae bacterium]|jgi:cyanophycinase|nr:cyanophycinase [Rhodanobacteraceae bacterium]
MPARLAPDRNRGLIIACGVISDDDRGAALLLRLVGLIGAQPRVVIVAATDPADEPDADFETTLYSAGAAEVLRQPIAARADCERRALLDACEHAQLVVLQADQPLRLSTLIGGTQLARMIRRRNADGLAVAGCGAGAALLCEHMLAHGTEGATPRLGGASLAPGLGLTNRVVIDQGGHASDRLGRLLAALALNPFALGLGIDPDTAAVIGPDNALEVIGAGGVTVIDPAEMADSNAADVTPGAPIRITNLRLHALTGGTRYDLDFRRAL